MKTKHTPEPHKLTTLKTTKSHVYIHSNETLLSFYLPGMKGFENKRADYINKCVNACEGIEDPTILPEFVQFAKELITRFSACGKDEVIAGKKQKEMELLKILAIRLVARARGEMK